MNSKPRYFRFKKYVLLLSTSISIVLLIIITVAIGTQNAEQFQVRADQLKAKLNLNSPDEDFAEKCVQIVIISMAFMFVLVQLIGFIGAWREHFCLTFTYVLLTTLSALLDIVITVFIGFPLWEAIAWDTVDSIIGLVYLRDLFVIRKMINQK